MPPQNPITRIEQVARDLGALARELEDYAGPQARRTLLYWQAELRAAIQQLAAARPSADERAPARDTKTPAGSS